MNNIYNKLIKKVDKISFFENYLSIKASLDKKH